MGKMTFWDRVLEFVEVMCDLGDYDWDSDFEDEPQKPALKVVKTKSKGDAHPA